MARAYKRNALGVLDVVLLKQLDSIRYISNWKRPSIRVIENVLSSDRFENTYLSLPGELDV